MFDIQTIRRMNSSGTMTKREVAEAFGATPAPGLNYGKVKRIGHNTWLVTSDNGVERIVFHKTAILTFRPDGGVTLRAGGWKTVTTKERLNRYGKTFGVWGERGEWFVRVYSTAAKYPFVEGMTIRKDGTVTEALGGVVMEPLPEGSPAKAARLGNVITRAIEAWGIACGFWPPSRPVPLGKRTVTDRDLFILLDKAEREGMAREDAWDLMDGHLKPLPGIATETIREED